MLVTLNEVLKDAQRGGYAVGLFNTIDTDMLEATISAAEELNSPIIIGTAESLLPYGSLSLVAPSFVDYAKKARVPVVVHFDHGMTFERCLEALKLGFSSVMYDGSNSCMSENISATREIVRIAHAFGATVEGEIGHVGEASKGENATSERYTTVDEAKEYIAGTSVDALAIAIGTAHGQYKEKPCLDFARLTEIRNAVDTPLVLHGGSGLSDDDFINSVRSGINKINIFTDLCLAGEHAVKTASATSSNYLQMRNAKVDAIKKAVMRKMELFGSVNKA